MCHIDLQKRELLVQLWDMERRRKLHLEQVGIPNHIGSKRFTGPDSERIAQLVQHMGLRLCNDPAIPDGPLEPPAEVQKQIEEVAETLGPSGGAATTPPWWCRMLCRVRDEMQGTAIGATAVADGRLYLWMYGKASPHEAMFLELRPGPILVGAVDVGGLPDFPPRHRQEFRWAEPLRLFSDDQVPLPSDGELVLVQGLAFVGELVIGNRAPVAFEDFFRWLPEQGTVATGGGGNKSGGGRKKAKLAPGALENILVDHPWLTKGELVDTSRAHGRKPPAPDDAFPRVRVPTPAKPIVDLVVVVVEEEEEEEAIVEAVEPDIDGEAVDVELAEVRAVMALDGSADEEYFTVRVLGGRWTMAHTGEVCDYVMGKTKGRLADQWAKGNRFPRSKRYSINKYTAEGARMFAAEFARRGNFFCNQWVDGWTNCDSFAHTAATNSEYPEELGFLDWACSLDVESPCFAALLELRQMYPRSAR